LKDPLRVSNNSNSIILKLLINTILDIIINRITRLVSLWINKNKTIQDLIIKDLFEDTNLRNLEKLFTNRFPNKIISKNNNFFPSKKLK
jgi:hypothetical protein